MWTVLLLVGILSAGGLSQQQGHPCDLNEVEICKQDLVTFESGVFPYYGSNEKELDQTCRSMNETLACLADFVVNCDGSPDVCDDECMKAMPEIATLAENTGIHALYSHLCIVHSPFRHTYLEHYDCLEKAMDEYSVCHNTSQESQKQIVTFYEEPEKHLNATCCFFSWYQDCYTNATMQACGANATFVVSFGLHLMIGHIVGQMCNPLVYCDLPPLPDDFLIRTRTTTMSNEIDIDSGASYTTHAFSAVILTIVFMVVNYNIKDKL